MKDEKEKRFDKFLDEEFKNEEVMKLSDGLIERHLIEKKLIAEDGRELLKEELPISHSNKKII